MYDSLIIIKNQNYVIPQVYKAMMWMDFKEVRIINTIEPSGFAIITEKLTPTATVEPLQNFFKRLEVAFAYELGD